MFGESLFVGPVVHPMDPSSQLTSEPIWIPAGEWIEWPTGKHFTGPRMVHRSFSIDQIPVYVRAGAIIPMQPELRYTGEKPVDPLIVNVFPSQDGQYSSYAVYEDSDSSEAYKDGAYARTQIQAHRSGAVLNIDIEPIQGHFSGMQTTRKYEVRLPADWPPASVSVNGRKLILAGDGKGPGWTYDGNTLTTTISLPRLPSTRSIRLSIRRTPGLVGNEALLDGFAGAITRLRSAHDSLDQTWPRARAPEDLTYASQTGDRITYDPAKAGEEIERFRGSYQRALQSATRILQQADTSSIQGKSSSSGSDGTADKDGLQRFRLRSKRALAQLHDGDEPQDAK